MVKKSTIKSATSFFMLVLLLPVFFASGSSVGSDQNGHTTLSNKFVSTQSLISSAELCEEKEAKDASESLHNTHFIEFTYPIYTSELLFFSLSIRKNPHSTFANTTNLPLYLAKQVFLI
ncbi:MAG: hypothetical protein ACK5RG_12940 [Cyclobacteriaceae bacterium]|jgi:hypothetical protein